MSELIWDFGRILIRYKVSYNVFFFLSIENRLFVVHIMYYKN